MRDTKFISCRADIFSKYSKHKGKPLRYARKGEKLKIISVSSPAVIVENGVGERFPMHIDDCINI